MATGAAVIEFFFGIWFLGHSLEFTHTRPGIFGYRLSVVSGFKLLFGLLLLILADLQGFSLYA